MYHGKICIHDSEFHHPMTRSRAPHFAVKLSSNTNFQYARGHIPYWTLFLLSLPSFCLTQRILQCSQEQIGTAWHYPALLLHTFQWMMRRAVFSLNGIVIPTNPQWELQRLALCKEVWMDWSYARIRHCSRGITWHYGATAEFLCNTDQLGIKVIWVQDYYI